MIQSDSGQVPWLRGAFHKLRQRAFRKWPRWFSDPDLESRLKIWRRRDSEHNEKTAPPPGEHVALYCLWALEYYTPTHIQSLLDKLAALGWDSDQFGSRNAVAWVQGLRGSAHSSGYFNLGAITRAGDKRVFASSRNGPLPPHVDYASGNIFNLTSSITCVSFAFVLEDHHTRRVNEALHHRYETWLEPLGHGHRHHGPESQKRAAIEGIRQDLRTMAADWFRTHLPGVFAAGLLDGDFPTCELMTLRTGKPFSRETGSDGARPGFFDALDIGADFYTWSLEEAPGLKFTESSYRDAHPFHAICAVNESDLPDEKLKMYGGRDRDGIITYVDDRVDDLLPYWGLTALLTGYERHLTSVRDTASPDAKTRRAQRRELERLRLHIAQSAETAGVAAALIDATEDERFTHGIKAFRPANPGLWKEESDITLAKALRNGVRHRAEWLQSADRVARDLHTQYASVLAALENIKLQASVRWLTWVLVVLTVAILILTWMMAFPSGR